MSPDLTVFPMNDELASAILFYGPARGIDGFALSDEHLPRFTFPLYLPTSVGRKHVDRLCDHSSIVTVGAASHRLSDRLLTPVSSLVHPI
jgi:hypothetical protein